MFWRRKPRRRVGLVNHEGRIKIVAARQAQCGWIANWFGLPETWVILKDDGTCEGHRLVKKWHKISGWPAEDQGDSDG